MKLKCFMVERTGEAAIELRRYSSNSRCDQSGYGYHNATRIIGRQPLQLSEERYVKFLPVDKSDVRYPTHCTCGYEFGPQDEWQRNQIEIWRNTETGEEYDVPRWKLPTGAMFYVDVDWPYYYPSKSDGRVLGVITPGGEWIIDGRANNGPRNAAGWDRTGSPPNITAAPSILKGTYHGWLRDGYLVEC